MQFLTVLAATASLVAPSLAAPAPLPESAAMAVGAAPATYWFNVTGWSAGCARAGCYYDFNVSAPRTETFPGFKAYCFGDDLTYMNPCKLLRGGQQKKRLPQVAAALKHENLSAPDGAQMSVSLQWTDVDAGATWNYTGHHTASYNQFVAPAEHFKVIPTEAWGIA